MDSAIRQALLKNDSIASQLDLIFAGTGKPRTIRIKLEIDVNPPAGSGEDATYLDRSEEHTSELQSLMRISYAVFCLKKKIKNTNKKHTISKTTTTTTKQ